MAPPTGPGSLGRVSVPVIRRSESPFEGARGHTLYRRAWLPPEPERVLVLVHGFAEHSGRYEHVGAWFAARGCAVHAYDQQGHGRSSGPRGHVRRFSDLLDDLGGFLAAVRGEHPGLPVFPVGHSMGGVVVASFARERQPEVAGCVLSAPALLLRVSRWEALLARVASRVAPRFARDAGIPPEWLSRDPEVVRGYIEDPLVFEKSTSSLAAGFFAAARRTLEGGADVRTPMLLLHGEADRLCPAEGSRRLYAQLTVPGKRLCLYPDLYHEIFNEPEQARVFGDLLDWVTSRKSGAAGTGGAR